MLFNTVNLKTMLFIFYLADQTYSLSTSVHHTKEEDGEKEDKEK